MNCQTCQKELGFYLQGKLPEDMKVQVEEHLKECKECTEEYLLINVSERVISEEKQKESNPFLATRIMAAIDQKQESYKVPVYSKLLKPVLISISIAVAIMLGVLEGDLYKPAQTNKIPAELVYMDDAAIESVNMFSNQ
jgi:predicted anti-sigma-YlaC factor YlaD